MLELRQHFPLAGLLQLAGLPRSTFYYQRRALDATRDKHVDLKARIAEIFEHHKSRYGYRRVTAELRQQGFVVNHKCVQRQMVAMKLKSMVRPKRYRSFRGLACVALPNLMQRDFTAQTPNEKWVTDVTEFKVDGKKLYLSPVMDLYNREIVSYEIADQQVSKMVESMLSKALRRLGPKERPMLHSDQGWQYRMLAFTQRLKQNGLVQSMSRKGNCYDNAAMESFFATLKSELFSLTKFECVDDLKQALHEYIRYYNVDRLKLSLKGLSPVAFRLRATAAAAET